MLLVLQNSLFGSDPLIGGFLDFFGEGVADVVGVLGVAVVVRA